MRRPNRYLWFAVSIAAGLALGLVYGWVVNPVKYVDTPPSNLRADYKADYALMTAEIYAADKDLTLASYRLTRLGEETPLRAVQQAILTGRELGYSEDDIALLAALAEALEALPPTAGGTP
ncbi:MAG: hypothetical protein IT308_09790 [Anaerolineaceae bacterium]|nr:hypothetical protein [Anaerolineaceae bacterium]